MTQLKLVIEHLAKMKMGATASNYLEPILPFILKEFLKQDKPWTDFPFQVKFTVAERFSFYNTVRIIWNTDRLNLGNIQNHFFKVQIWNESGLKLLE